MAAPKKRFQALRTIAAFILIFAALIPLCAYCIAAFILLLPYSLYHFSSNWGIRKKDMPVVQKYLDLFQALHPRLAEHLSQVFQSARWKNAECPFAVRFWPHDSKTEYACMPPIVTSVTDHTFSPAAGLFVMLEALHFPRHMLWEFLMEEVESHHSVNEAEKAEFRRVMDKMCTGYLVTIIFPGKDWKKREDNHKHEKGFSLPEAVPMGCQVVPLKEGDGMEWVLFERGLIVPMDWVAFNKAMALKRFGLWTVVKEDLDLEKGNLPESWQYVDGRCV
ncbi:MAG: hypothetical protein LQ346_004330 [Caloplaca aetnensis]|nr:MAG: hypothetical protein LQ346_004330 [Caloplaca aetnensis]